MRSLTGMSAIGAFLGCLPSTLSNYEEPARQIKRHGAAPVGSFAQSVRGANDPKPHTFDEKELRGLWLILNDDEDSALEYDEWISGTDGMLPEDDNGGSTRAFNALDKGEEPGATTNGKISEGEMDEEKELRNGMYRSLEWRDLDPLSVFGGGEAFELDDLASFAAAVIIKDLEEADGELRDDDGAISKDELDKIFEKRDSNNAKGVCALLGFEKEKETECTVDDFMKLDTDKDTAVEVHEVAVSIMD